MPNHARTQADGTWVDGYAPPPSDWVDLERKIFGSWNGDRGGAYSPVYGAGGSWTIAGQGLQVLGPTRLTYGGTIRGGSGAFVVGDGTWPELALGHTGRTRSIVQPIVSFRTPRRYLWSRYHAYCGVGSVALACRSANGRSIETADLYVPLDVVDGSTLTKVALTFRVASRRTRAPLGMPKMRIVRVPWNVGADQGRVLPEFLKDTTDGQGFDGPALVTTPDAWYAGGDVQTFEYVCDQNHTIDVSKYSYVAHIVEELGAVDPDDAFDGVCFVERKADVIAVGPNTTTLSGGGTVDGVAAARALIVDTDDILATGEPEPTGLSAKNGIWDTQVGNWTRATDLDGQDDFTPGWIVKVASGQINAGSTWQCDYPTSRTKVDLTTGITGTLAKTQPRIQPAVPRGNIYHALVPTFDVPVLRFR